MAEPATRLLHELLFAQLPHNAEKTALRTEAQLYTYAQLAAAVKQAAAFLQERRLRPGSRVAIVLPNSAETIIAVFACSLAGLVFIVLSPEIKPFHLQHVFADAEPELLLTNNDFRNQHAAFLQTAGIAVAGFPEIATQANAEPAAVAVQPENLLCLIYTSGSTGLPKAIMSQHRQVLFAVNAIQQRLQYAAGDTVGCFLPLSFDYGLYQSYLAFNAGATLALGIPADSGPLFLKKLANWNINVLPVSPNMMRAMLTLLERRRFDRLPLLRIITNTGGHIPLSQIESFQQYFPACGVYLMYGLTECKRVSILLPEEFPLKKQSVGRALNGTTCYIVNEEGEILPPGNAGELVVTGAHVMPGYWNAPQLTAEKFRNWNGQTALFTGDRCTMDADGFIYFFGRTDELFKHNGFRLSALEIETAACAIPGVTGAALAVPQKEGEKVVLFVTPETCVAQTVLEELAQRLEVYKLPDVVMVCERFPLTPNGKTDKQQLKQQYDGAATAN